VAIYPFKRAFSLAHGSIDVQTGMAYLPPIEGSEAEFWYINMGAVGEEFPDAHRSGAMIHAKATQHFHIFVRGCRPGRRRLCRFYGL